LTAILISWKGLAIRLINDKAFILLISINSSFVGGISDVLKTDHKIVVRESIAPM